MVITPVTHEIILLSGLADESGVLLDGVAKIAEKFGRVHHLKNVPNMESEMREAVSFDIMLDTLEQGLPPLTANKRLILIGYSIGGTLAFALADRLCRRGQPTHLVILIDSSAVYYPSETSLTEDIRNGLRQGIHHLVRNLPLQLALRFGWLSAARAYVAYGRAINIRSMRGATKILLVRYWVNAISNVRLPIYSGRVILYKAVKHRPRIKEFDLGWGPFAKNLQIKPIPGDHWSILDQPELYHDLHAVLSK